MEKTLLIVQIFATAFIAATFIIYFFQLRAMRDSSKAQNTLSIINFLQDPQVREARRVVLTILKDKPFSSWNEEEKRLASLVQTTYDIAGMLIKQKLVPIDIFVDNWSISFVRCYKILEPYIEELRSQTSNNAKYGLNLKWLCDQATNKQKS